MKRDLITDANLIKEYNETDYGLRNEFYKLLSNSPVPSEEIWNNIGLYLDRRLISRYLWLNELYQLIIGIHGSIFEFGVRYGQNLSLFISLRGIYEPYNHNRKIVGFDTFSGFPELENQRDLAKHKVGDYAVPENYKDYLESVLKLHERFAPIEAIIKFELVEGDATKTVHEYLANHQETIISLAYFDFDIYKPTFDCLNAILPYLTKNSIIAFDEINTPDWPGETKALREVLGTKNFTIRHSMFRASAGYIIFD